MCLIGVLKVMKVQHYAIFVDSLKVTDSRPGDNNLRVRRKGHLKGQLESICFTSLLPFSFSLPLSLPLSLSLCKDVHHQLARSVAEYDHLSSVPERMALSPLYPEQVIWGVGGTFLSVTKHTILLE